MRAWFYARRSCSLHLHRRPHQRLYPGWPPSSNRSYQLFRRASTRQSAERYCTGLLTDLARKTCDGIAAAVAATTTERLQHLLTDANWDSVALDRVRFEQMVEASPAGGVLAIDDTTFPKQGEHKIPGATSSGAAIGGEQTLA